MKYIFTILFTGLLISLRSQDTFSIVAVDPATGEIGSAGASCLDNIGFPGSNGAIIISDILPGRGAIHTQSYWVAANQNNARARMQDGMSPAQIITWLKQNDAEGQFGQTKRQYGIVDFDSMGMPRSAAHTGNFCLDWKGHHTGTNYAIQGNILLGQQIIDSIEAHFLALDGYPLAVRLMYALQGANVVGADSRCTANGTSSLSAFIRMAKPDDDPNALFLDLNVPSLPAGMEPIDSLQKLFDAWKAVNATDLEKIAFRVFPNPSNNGNITVDWPETVSGQIKIVSVDGKQVYAGTVNQGINNIALKVPAGSYSVSITTEKQTSTVKKLLIMN